MKRSKDIFPRDKRAPADIVYGFSGGAEKIYSVHRKPASQGEGFMGLAPERRAGRVMHVSARYVSYPPCALLDNNEGSLH